MILFINRIVCLFSAQDQQTIQKLKERIAQLDIENSLLTRASSTSGLETEENEEVDLDTLLKRISKLKVLIRVANDRFGQSLTIEGIFTKFLFHFFFLDSNFSS